jgi:hypothetical protein
MPGMNHQYRVDLFPPTRLIQQRYLGQNHGGSLETNLPTHRLAGQRMEQSVDLPPNFGILKDTLPQDSPVDRTIALKKGTIKG